MRGVTQARYTQYCRAKRQAFRDVRQIAGAKLQAHYRIGYQTRSARNNWPPELTFPCSICHQLESRARAPPHS